MPALNTKAHRKPTTSPVQRSVIGLRHPNRTLSLLPTAEPISAGSTKYPMYPRGTEEGSPPHVMFSGHHDGIRGSAGGNCAYIAQSYGASMYEIEIAEMQTSRNGCRRPRRMLRYMPIATKTMPLVHPQAFEAISNGVIAVFNDRALRRRARALPCRNG